MISYPVTAGLAEAMTQTEEFIEAWDTHRINDQSHYAGVVTQLTSLAHAVLSASAHMGPVTGARLTYEVDDAFNHRLFSVAQYLREDAANLLAYPGKNLSKYSSDHTNEAFGFLQSLLQGIRERITAAAISDLKIISGGRSATLIEHATTLANAPK